MKWLGVVGTREVNANIRDQIRQDVATAINEGWAIVSGGGTGADHEAAQLAYEKGLDAVRFRLYLPTSLDIYAEELVGRATLGKCKIEDVEVTVTLLREIKQTRPGIIIDITPFSSVNAQSFHARNDQVVKLADKLMAYRVNNSAGTTYTAEQALKAGKEVIINDYGNLN